MALKRKFGKKLAAAKSKSGKHSYKNLPAIARQKHKSVKAGGGGFVVEEAATPYLAVQPGAGAGPRGQSYNRPKTNRRQLVHQMAAREEARLTGNLLQALETDGATAADVNTLCQSYGLRREELGRLTGFSLRALADWAADKVPSQPARRRLHEVRRLLDALTEVVKQEAITPWLHQPNTAFDNLTPLQVIEIGEIDRLWAMLHERAGGGLS